MALAIGAAVISTAVVAYSTMSRSNTRLRTIGNVELPAGVLDGFYNTATNTVSTYFAPNYGRVALAEALREKLYQDVGKANAVYCLVRGDSDRLSATTRQERITVGTNYDARRLGTPNAFRPFLPASTASKFTDYSGVPGSSTLRNLSIFVLKPSTDPSSLRVQSIYELDFVNAITPPGTFASVRRYVGGVCTDYYDVFYPSSALTVPFHPVVTYFERSTGSGPGIYKQAANRPFYFVWWPDPSSPTYEAPLAGLPGGNGTNSAYAAMTGRTAFFMVLPAFPSL